MANPDRAARSEHWRLVRAEQEALLRYDIPYFSARADSTDLDLPGGERISGFFSRSGSRTVAGQDHRDRSGRPPQAGPVHPRRFLLAVGRHRPSPAAPEGPGRPRRRAGGRPSQTSSSIAAAQRIAERLWDEAIRVAGGAAWIGLDYRQQTRRYQYQPVGYGFYSGRCGIGLFLAALWSVTGEERWRELALGAVAGVRRGLRAHGARRTWSVADASVAYALGRMGMFFGDQDLRRDALAVAGRIDAATIAADETFDVLFGSAGAALSFLTLHRLYGEEGLLDQGGRLRRAPAGRADAHRNRPPGLEVRWAGRADGVLPRRRRRRLRAARPGRRDRSRRVPRRPPSRGSPSSGPSSTRPRATGRTSGPPAASRPRGGSWPPGATGRPGSG